MFRTFLKRIICFCLSLVISASILLACFSTESNADTAYSLSGTSFIINQGLTVGKSEYGLLTIGERGSGKGLQTLNISLDNLAPGLSGSLQYRIYVYKYGWQDWTDAGQITGMTTMPRLITAVQMRLTGDLAKTYSIWYSAWTNKHKDLEGWVCDEGIAGDNAESGRIEEFRVMLVKRDTQYGYTDVSFRTYMSGSGWQRTWRKSGEYSGLPGLKRRVSGFEVTVTGNEYSGGVRYRGLIAGSAWTNWVTDGALCGTTNRNKRMEALEIQLTGEIANHYDIYYRTYIGGLGWFNWAKNGEASGTRGIGRRIDALQIKLVRKGYQAPGAVISKARSVMGYTYVATNNSTGVSEWRIGKPGSGSFASYVLKRCKYYNRTEYKDMRCDALVAQVLTDALGTNLGKRKGAKYARLNEWIGLSALERLLSSTFTYKDASGRTVICRPVARTPLKTLVKKTWKKKEKNIPEEEFNEWIKKYCEPGDILIFYNKKKKPIHCGIYSGVQSSSVKEYEYFHGRKKGQKDSDIKPGHYLWHSGYDTGVANKYAYWAAEIGRSYYVRRYRVDSGRSHPAPPRK